MGKKKTTDIRIKVAAIGGTVAIIAALVGSPYFDSLYKDRPIIDISLGGLETELPFKELPSDPGGYLLDFVSRNRGNDDGKIVVTIVGENVKFRGNSNLEWAYEKSVNFIIFPDPVPRKTPFYVLPDENTQSFSIEIFVTDQNDRQQFQKINLISPTKITYEKTDTGYRYVQK